MGVVPELYGNKSFGCLLLKILTIALTRSRQTILLNCILQWLHTRVRWSKKIFKQCRVHAQDHPWAKWQKKIPIKPTEPVDTLGQFLLSLLAHAVWNFLLITRISESSNENAARLANFDTLKWVSVKITIIACLNVECFFNNSIPCVWGHWSKSLFIWCLHVCILL